ncbi:hypothetical protein, variant 2 [Saprolegnia diclina VS20]|uniref:AAA+ ATPase domain-containing protein n=1 Tax=Saprolegnia diclina (strain VS20) TaxID=1156394 RepID=T0Q404_SAPDV|nr:hypothetical protein SDRG_09870 [Saprolegnia diclina VS20]XP_008614049.1 hypothetical protein, variant 1 [Saprolegnia diclina VS20]XP_008614050.1 hypothetical protein, variant 2 [Saprolegnia diclina VS20]EQC32547.1 hypothetical protein SDRG_09870 [Saprolegnia diclina VS20]EQC32548.1 hypothetical protein, variant 1 [Saprolegnia diclina VS20]EQC32549.1 hypothetical protein, variant 2 [Saprolegnia diclina VS20]|eukprot:XP_008614048.1 hypothetical protein SDRG_09870 [Saprolegnia diclina VS20]
MAKRCVRFALLCMLACIALAAEKETWKDKLSFFQATVESSLAEGVEWLGFHSGLGPQCDFVEHPSVAVRSHLQKYLTGQDRSLDSIVGAIESWEFSRTSSKDHGPLVMAITGPTGTGKTETSTLIAEGLFRRRRKLDHSEKLVPTGLLVFRGEDFSDNYTNPVTQYQEQIKSRLVEHLTKCSGKAVVVFDEVQKVIPQTLDVLTSAMSSNAQLTYYKNGVARKVDCSNVIFILISDIGVGNMENIMIQYESRDELPFGELENEVKKALDAQWDRLQFGKMIKQVIPFLPFEQRHIIDVINLKLRHLSVNYEGKYWYKLDIEPGIAQHLSTLESIPYQARRASVNGKELQKVFAKYGARSVESGPIQQLKSKLLRYLRPWNTKATITVSFVPSTEEVVITSCSSEAEDVDDEFASVGCRIKWQGKFK